MKKGLCVGIVIPLTMSRKGGDICKVIYNIVPYVRELCQLGFIVREKVGRECISKGHFGVPVIVRMNMICLVP